MNALPLLCSITMLVSASALAETRVFVSQSGTTMEAEVVAVSATSVTVKRKADGAETAVPLASLCGEDKTYLADWAKRHGVALASNTPITQPKPTSSPTPAPSTTKTATAPAEPKINLAGAVNTRKSDRPNTNLSDYRTTKLQMDLVLQNKESKRDLAGAHATFAVFSKNVTDPNDLKVLLHESFPVDIAALGKMEHPTPEMKLEYDNLNTYRYGFKYQGHVLLVKDATGREILNISTPADYAKIADRILTLKQGQSIDRQLRPAKRVGN